MSKKVSLIIILVIIIATGAFFWQKNRKAKNGAENMYKTAAVERGNVTMTVTATGTASAVTTVLVGSQVSGVIARLYADFNSPVTKGQLLAELDPTPFEAQVQQRRADVQKSEVDLRNSEISLRRQNSLRDQGLAPQADFDAAQAVHDIAMAQLEQSRAALSQSETNLHYTKILSPIDGVVAARQYDVGQTVAASFQAPTLFTIAQDLTKMQIQADVDQADIGRIKIGQHSAFTVDAYPEEQFDGRIAQIRLNATVNQNVVTYPVIIEVANPEKKLRPNMTANVIIDVAEVTDVVRVPNGALRFKPEVAEDAGNGKPPAAQQQAQAGPRPQGGEAGSRQGPARNMGEGGRQGGTGFDRASAQFDETRGSGPKKPAQSVYVLRDGKLEKVEIRTGISDGRFTQVVDGKLKEGDQVVIGTQTTKATAVSFPGGGSGPGGGGGRGRM